MDIISSIGIRLFPCIVYCDQQTIIQILFYRKREGEKPVNQILEKAKRMGNGKQHFVIDKSPHPKQLAMFEELGITPIIVEDYAEIATVLKELFFAGLETSDWKKFDLRNDAYWERLKTGPEK